MRITIIHALITAGRIDLRITIVKQNLPLKFIVYTKNTWSIYIPENVGLTTYNQKSDEKILKKKIKIAKNPPSRHTTASLNFNQHGRYKKLKYFSRKTDYFKV